MSQTETAAEIAPETPVTTAPATAAATRIEKVHITRTPGLCGGKACIAGHRIRVQDIFVWHERQGKSADEIVAEFPQITHADVYAALAYFWDNRDEILGQMEAAKEIERQARIRHPSKLAAKLKEMNAPEVSP